MKLIGFCFENVEIDLLVKISWNFYLIIINVFISFQNDYNDENESFGIVCLYVGNFKKTMLRKDLKMFENERVSKGKYFGKPRVSDRSLASKDLLLAFGHFEGFYSGT